MNSNTHLETVYAKVYEYVAGPSSPAALKPAAKRAEFCMSLCLVALGIRLGYLVDSFIPAKGVQSFELLLRGLRQVVNCFSNVCIVFNEDAIKYFFVNRALLKAYKESTQEVSYVLLGSETSLTTCPPSFALTLKNICDSTDDTFLLPDDLEMESLVPLAGLLLDYEVAYVPASPDSASSLKGILLDVYTVELLAPEMVVTLKRSEIPVMIPTRHTVLKFSCPSVGFHMSDLLSPENVNRRLDLKFRERLDSVGCSWAIRVTHEIVKREGIAL